MFIILGASGHVGSAVAAALLDNGERVTAVIHNPGHAAAWTERRADVAILDVHDSRALRDVLQQGTRAFLLNPPAPVSSETEIEEQSTRRSIVAALNGSKLKKVVLASTYGAQPGERCGDLNILYDFEQALSAQSIPTVVQRAAYYMSNWDGLLDSARGGSLPTMLPADLKLPMVAPADLGEAAARRLREPPGEAGIHYVEGPERYSPRNVADAFGVALGRPVKVMPIAREDWLAAFKEQGFSEAAAHSFARMTKVSIDGGFAMLEHPERGPTSLQSYISNLVQRNQSKGVPA